MKYHNITKDDMNNGDGLRVVLWVSGCSHRCPECHNQITWNANCGLEFDEKAKQEIFAELNKSYVSGITFSGGDPLYEKNIHCVTEFAKELKNKYPNKNRKDRYPRGKYYNLSRKFSIASHLLCHRIRRYRCGSTGHQQNRHEYFISKA